MNIDRSDPLQSQWTDAGVVAKVWQALPWPGSRIGIRIDPGGVYVFDGEGESS